MRKILFSLLLASAAASPAVAGPRDHSDRDAARAERAERQQAREEARSEARAERAMQRERPQVQRERPQFSGDDHRQVQPARAERAASGDAPDSVRERRGARREQAIEEREQAVQDRPERFGDRSLRQHDRAVPPVMRSRVPIVSDTPREGTQPPLRVERTRRDTVRWSTDWRRDNRYDWRRWRDRHRSWFNLGFYYDPFGWGYQPYSIGWRMWPSYYGSRYWISDPWQYRLPYAPPGYRWIRYWDDAVLVDTWTGEVVDVIHNFFW